MLSFELTEEQKALVDETRRFTKEKIIPIAAECDRKHTFPNDVFDGTEIDGGYDGNVTKTAVGFWLRRSLDGTEPAFFEALVRLMNTYERPQ